jgi:hypothetical protein
MIPIEGDEGTPPYWHTPFALVASLVTPPPPPPADNFCTRLDNRTISEASQSLWNKPLWS